MKLVVFAHTPPPHHGQSYMVQLMLEGFGGDCAAGGKANAHGIECFHVNAKMSDDMEDIGGIRPGKILRLLKHCLQAIRYRFRYGVTTLYYIPAPAKKSAVVRDWIVMLLVRPFFKRTVLHWHAFGLGHWAGGVVEHPSGKDGPAIQPPCVFGTKRQRRRMLNAECSMLNEQPDAESAQSKNLKLNIQNSKFERFARRLTRELLGGADLSIVLTEYNRADAALLQPKKIAVVPNGIPDPCADFEESVLPVREARHALFKECLMFNGECSIQEQTPEAQTPHSESTIQNLPFQEQDTVIFHVLFLAHCTREKGLFDTLDAVALANSELRIQHSPLRIALTVAGSFMNEEERKEFDARISRPDLQLDHDFLPRSPFKTHESDSPTDSIQNCRPGRSRCARSVAASFKTRHSDRCAVRYVGFVSNEEKATLFREADCFCFPTRYPGETFGLVVAEALAFDLPVVTTRWRGVHELLPDENLPPVSVGAPPEIAARLLEATRCGESSVGVRRRHFLRAYAEESHLGKLSRALKASIDERN